MADYTRGSYNQQFFDNEYARRSKQQYEYGDGYTRRSFDQQFNYDNYARSYNNQQSDYYYSHKPNPYCSCDDCYRSIKDERRLRKMRYWEDRRKEESQRYEKMVMEDSQNHQLEYYYSSIQICNNPNCSCLYRFNPHDTKTTVFEHRKPIAPPPFYPQTETPVLQKSSTFEKSIQEQIEKNKMDKKIEEVIEKLSEMMKRDKQEKDPYTPPPKEISSAPHFDDQSQTLQEVDSTSKADDQPQNCQAADSTQNFDEHIRSDSFTPIAHFNSELINGETLVNAAGKTYELLEEDGMSISLLLGNSDSRNGVEMDKNSIVDFGIDEELDNKIVVDFGKDVQMDNKMNDAQPLFDKMFERLENAHHMFDIMLVRGIENDGHKISVVMGKALKLFGEFSQREGFVYDLLAQVVEQTYRALLMRIVDQMYDVLLLHGGEQTYMKLLVFVVESHDVLLNIASKSAQYSASWQGNAQPTYLFFSFLAMHSIRVAHKFHHAHTETVVKDTSEDTGVKTLHRHNKKGGNITDQFGRVTDNIEVVSIRIKHYRLALHKNCMRAFEDVVRNKEACGGLLFHEYATGKAEISAGTPLRRYNELALKKEIQELLAGWKLFKITYTSDYFQERYDLTVELIRRGLACVDHQTGKEIKEYNIQIHGKLQVVEQRVELIKCSIKWLFSSSFVGIFWCCTHICDLHQAKAIGVPGTSSPFTDDAVSVAASIKYHAEFTAASSPEGFELNKAYFAAAQSVRDQTAMSRIMMLEDKHELKERDLSCPCILNGMKRHRFVANSQQQKSMPGTCLN